VGALVLALVVLSVLDTRYFLRGAIFDALSLGAADLARGQLWRLATWPLLEARPLGLALGVLVLWQTGGQLAWSWGQRRFLWICLALAVGSGLVAMLVSVFWSVIGFPQMSVWPLLVALMIMQARERPGVTISFFGVLPMSSEQFVWLLVGSTVLFGLFDGVARYVLHFAAIGFAFVFTGPELPFRRWWYRFRAELHVRSSRRRAVKSRLKVVGKNGQDDPPRWMN